MIKVTPSPPPQHRSRAPGRAHPLGTYLLKPALNEGREGDTHGKIFIQRGAESGDSSFRSGCPRVLRRVCDAHRCPQRRLERGCRTFYPISTMQKSLVINIGDATWKIRGNPSQPVRLFWCNEQPLYLIFQNRDSALTSPFLCCAKPHTWWPSARLVGLFCSPATRRLLAYTQEWMHADTHTDIHL